ncbi:MAG: type II toxin-antitoxin system antitoxin SocA domain-containing protein [Bacteroidales bacterium]|jgi:uncharacterized phage-associated protein/DNA-binding transcriptional regulator YiaG|nr:type II toxin-antitoxin system antitoxin SocA domain-containing protein [Bacteroidales bacterium]
MKSPFANCDATFKCEKSKLTFRKESFEYVHLFYECNETKERFTTDEIDEVNVSQIYNQYRVKYGIPFPDEIKQIREKYDLPATKMSQILGFGDNQYRLYENGEMPSEANGKILMSIMLPQVFDSYIHNAKNQFTPDEYAKILSKANIGTINKEKEYLKNIIFDSERGVFNGFAKRSLTKLKNTMLFFIDRCGSLFKTKMNKLLFYTDFYAYKTYGMAITGLSYKAIQFGPIPNNYKKIYAFVDEIDEMPVSFGNVEGDKLVSTIQPDMSVFSEKELNVLNQVATKFGNMTSKEMSEISHNEDAWKNNVGNFGAIDFSYAFSLKAI